MEIVGACDLGIFPSCISLGGGGGGGGGGRWAREITVWVPPLQYDMVQYIYGIRVFL